MSSLQQILRGSLGVLFGIGFMDLFSFYEDDLDKVLCLFVPLLCCWYEDDSVAFKVSACSVCLTLSSCLCVTTPNFCMYRTLEWHHFTLFAWLVLMGNLWRSTNSTLGVAIRLKVHALTRLHCILFLRYFK